MPRGTAHTVRTPNPTLAAALAAALAVALCAGPAAAQTRKVPPKSTPAKKTVQRKPLIKKAPDRTDEPAPAATPAAAPAGPAAPAVEPAAAGPRPLRQPPIAKPGTPLWADSVREAAAFETAVRTQAYDRVGQRDGRLDERARALLRLSAAAAADPFDPSPPDLLTPARELINQGATDPLVRAVYASALAAAGPAPNLLPTLQEAADAMRGSDYSPFLKAEAVAELAAALHRLGLREKATAAFADAVSLYTAALASTPRPPAQHLEHRLARRIAEQFPPDVARALCEQFHAAGADPWLTNMLYGRYHDRLAASAQPAREALAQARARYEAAFRASPARPAAAAAMIPIARQGLSRPEQDFNFWFDRAVEAQFDYPPAYRNMLAALRPASGGDHQAMLGFGLACAQTERFDTRVPYQFIQAALDVCEDANDFTAPWRQPKVYDIAKQVLTRYIRADASAAAQNRVLLAAIAWRAARYDDAQLLLDTISPSGDLSPAALVRASPREMTEDVDARTGPAAHLYAQADEAAARGDLAAARALCEQALEVSRPAGAHLVVGATARLAAARFAEAFHSGNWADLPFDSDSALWLPVRGRWTADSTETIRAEAAPGGPLLALRIPTGFRFQVQGQITFGPAAAAPTASAGLGFGFDPQNHASNAWFGLLLFPSAARVGLAQGWPLAADHPYAAAPGPATFDLVCFDGDLRLTINSKPVYSGPVPPGPTDTLGQTLVLGSRSTSLPGPIEFAHLRIRKLAEPPSP